MNRAKYGVWLLCLVLAGVIIGAIWYVFGREEEKTITDGTLVWNESTWNKTDGYGAPGWQPFTAGWEKPLEGAEYE